MQQHTRTGTPHRAPVPSGPARRGARRLAGAAVAIAATVGLTLLGGPGAHAADNPYERGPAPTTSSIEALRGPYAVSETSVSSLAVTGFGGGTIYYPTSTSDGTFGAVAVSPGYTGTQSSIAWLGPRLASQGFVVFTIDTLTTLDQPDSRGRQLLAALDYLTGRSSVRGRIDSSRLGVMGHSMGGGGSLEAAKSRPSLQAAIPLTPWNLDKTWPEISTPTLIFGADGDTIAPVASHAEPFYSTLPSSLDRAYLELNNATHFTPNSSNTTIAKYSISWLKRFIDNDTRYEQFLCPLPRPSLTIDEYRGNCPHTS
ncbi:dienelactone hydrolase family protein [Streptomyces galbus]|uniref:Alpha/beta hydrolase n=1 Tax=Streptomyces galbus TaxID=33898 RepID=A0ABX1IS70_STRGB|nr:alpha/beta hydrolase [Streptomyces galbus]